MNNFYNKLMSTFVVFLITCFFSVITLAQTTLEDVVYLKNGSILRGQVLEYTPSTNIEIKIKGGSILIYPSSEVLKIEKEPVVTSEEKPETTETLPVKTWEQHVPSKGLYGTAAIGNIFPVLRTSIPLPGLILDATIGYRFHHLFAIGVGGGIMLDFSQSFIYGHGSIRGAILNKSFSPYYEINAGYGQPLSMITFSNDSGNRGIQQLTVMRGGLYVRPSIGMRFASRNRIHTFIDAGLYIQRVYYEGRTWNNFSYTEQYMYMRPSVRVGMIF